MRRRQRQMKGACQILDTHTSRGTYQRQARTSGGDIADTAVRTSTLVFPNTTKRTDVKAIHCHPELNLGNPGHRSRRIELKQRVLCLISQSLTHHSPSSSLRDPLDQFLCKTFESKMPMLSRCGPVFTTVKHRKRNKLRLRLGVLPALHLQIQSLATTRRLHDRTASLQTARKSKTYCVSFRIKSPDRLNIGEEPNWDWDFGSSQFCTY